MMFWLGMWHQAVRVAASSIGSACIIRVGSGAKCYSCVIQLTCAAAVSSPKPNSSLLHDATAHQAIWHTHVPSMCRLYNHGDYMSCSPSPALCAVHPSTRHAGCSWQSSALASRCYSSTSHNTTPQQGSMLKDNQQAAGVHPAVGAVHQISLSEAQNDNVVNSPGVGRDRQVPDATGHHAASHNALAGAGSVNADLTETDKTATSAAGKATLAAAAAAEEEEEARQRAWDQEDDEDRGGSFLTTGPEGEGELELPSTFEVVGGAAASAFLAVAVAGLGMVAMLWLTTWISKAAKPTERQKAADPSGQDAVPVAAQQPA